MEKRLIKILRRDDLDLEIVFNAPAESGAAEKRSVRSPDPAEEKFYTRLQGMHVHLLQLLNLPADYKKGLKVTGIILKWDGELAEVMITAEKEIDGLKPWKIRTPATLFSGPAAMDVEDLCTMAIAYAEGERSQLEMQFDAPAEELPGVETVRRARAARSKHSRSMTSGVH